MNEIVVVFPAASFTYFVCGPWRPRFTTTTCAPGFSVDVVSTAVPSTVIDAHSGVHSTTRVASDGLGVGAEGGGVSGTTGAGGVAVATGTGTGTGAGVEVTGGGEAARFGGSLLSLLVITIATIATPTRLAAAASTSFAREPRSGIAGGGCET